jgi:hypothetical protein
VWIDGEDGVTARISSRVKRARLDALVGRQAWAKCDSLKRNMLRLPL